MNIVKNILLYLVFFSLSSLMVGCHLGIREIPREKSIEKYANESSGSKFIEVNGVDVHYRDQGEGPVLIAIHGFADSLLSWDIIAQGLKKDFRIIRFDIPGNGLSKAFDNVDKNLPDNFVSFIDSFADQLGLETFSLMGNSLGGCYSWVYAVERPERVSKIILVNSAGRHMDFVWVLSMAANPVFNRMFRLAFPRFYFSTGLKYAYGDNKKLKKETIDRFYELAISEGNKKSILDLFILFGKEYDFHNQEDMPLLKAPTFLIWGKEDKIVPFSHVEGYKKDIPHAQIWIIPGMGHVPNNEDPSVLIEPIRDFLLRSKE
jgi:pimeloyl-ACP methyl ester carboxylesterase